MVLLTLSCNGTSHIQKISFYCVFDVICKDGQSIASKPLTVRKTVLNSLELNHPNVFVIEGIQGNGLTYFALAKEKIRGNRAQES